MAKDPNPEDGSTDLVPTRASPYPVSRLAPRFDLVDIAQEIQKADDALGMVVGAKLDVIREQMRVLQEEARRILEEARSSAELHRARCTFRKIPGNVYHLYRKPDGELYFSMLSPEEWGGRPPHAFQGSYRLNVDMSFQLLTPP